MSLSEPSRLERRMLPPSEPSPVPMAVSFPLSPSVRFFPAYSSILPLPSAVSALTVPVMVMSAPSAATVTSRPVSVFPSVSARLPKRERMSIRSLKPPASSVELRPFSQPVPSRVGVPSGAWSTKARASPSRAKEPPCPDGAEPLRVPARVTLPFAAERETEPAFPSSEAETSSVLPAASLIAPVSLSSAMLPAGP